MVDSTAAKGSPAPSCSNATAAAFRACAESHRVSNLNKLAKSVHHTSFRWSGADEVVAEFMGIIYQIERWATRVSARIPTKEDSYRGRTRLGSTAAGQREEALGTR